MGIFDWKHWIVILVVVVLVFGTKKLKNLGTDVGESIKGFRKAMNDEKNRPIRPRRLPSLCHRCSHSPLTTSRTPSTCRRKSRRADPQRR
jgi:TatA/E family protein of Tat protein translocase